ncbi:VOC family protein (plasmid) [Leisingera sp. M527]|uniref:VOC family protein n=1 Tax=Leisingera sp. M527 TaxID=2867014 RepID=UPI0021A778AB|nr:VOC family protein [Leisingera sp. M527]UWQ35443.1 VOC family protein [Leisingera sp. M527]
MSFNVGGVQLDRPFKIRRLGHFGFNVEDLETAREFYCDLLGMKISDPIDFAPNYPDVDFEGAGETVGYFLRHGADHHSFAIFPKGTLNRMMNDEVPEDMTVNQVSWHVGTMEEVFIGNDWLAEQGFAIPRIGRDSPGSNWHTYPAGPEGFLNELYAGMEQIGWDGRSKPADMSHKFEVPPELPYKSEYTEVIEDEAKGATSVEGWRHEEKLPFKFDVEGLLLPQPFKIIKVGPARLFMDDIETAVKFYSDTLGLHLTETVTYQGHNCYFFRANTEHHSLALYPTALREVLGVTDKKCMSFGFQLGSYKQLRNAVSFMSENGYEPVKIPAELMPGMDYTAYFRDPDGHLIQLYAYMAQVSADGGLSAGKSRTVQTPWPETIEALPDEYHGEVFLGPLA